MLLAVSMAAGALDFTVAVPSGQTLKFSTLSVNTVQVAMQTTKPVGDLVIPATVTYEGTTYSVTRIASMAFRLCTDLTSVVLPEGLQVIGQMAFYGDTNLASITLPSTLTEIGIQAFTKTRPWLDHEDMGADGLFYIGNYLIHFDIDSVGGHAVVREGTLGVANSACFRDTVLTKITLPASLRFIGYQAFEGCRHVDTVFVLGTTPPRLAEDGLASIDGLTISVPCGSAATYRAAAVWGLFPIVENCGGDNPGGGGDDPGGGGDEPGGGGDEPGGGNQAVTRAELQPAQVAVVAGGISIRSDVPRRCLVTDMVGRRVASMTVSGQASVQLPCAGIYLVSLEGYPPLKVAYLP